MPFSIIRNQRIKDKCQIFTPADIVTKMLDLANYRDNLFGKKVLENSCGDGEFLSQIVQRYIESCKNNNLYSETIKAGLEKDIIAYEIDKDRILECIEKLNAITEKYGISQVKWNIHCEDFLKSKRTELFDFIIGNPPYIAYPDLPSDVQKYVKDNFETCKKGKFDYSYAFIEKSYHWLSNDGILVYIIPSNIFKNVFASELRTLIKPDIEVIVDFPTDSVFKKVLVSPAIIKIVNAKKTKTLRYMVGESIQLLEKNLLGEKWAFNSDKTVQGIRVGDCFKIASSVATLLNEAFIVKNGIIEDEYYKIDHFKIEMKLLKKAASPKNKKYKKFEEYIIFPYFYDENGELQHYSEEEIYNKFPCAMEYLESYKEKLKKRDSDKKALWFEYGRSQALQNLNQRMILISSVISNCTQAYLLEKEEIPYSGLYIVPTRNISLDILVPILNSENFKKYINSVGVCVSGTSKRVTPSDIENFVFESNN